MKEAWLPGMALDFMESELRPVIHNRIVVGERTAKAVEEIRKWERGF